MQIFHGGCHDCTMQTKKGLGYCVGCKFFECNWNLPDLNDVHLKEEERLIEIRMLAKAQAINR